MIYWSSKKKQNYEYRRKILGSFPQDLKNEVERVLDIIPFKKNIHACDGKKYEVNNLINDDYQSVLLNGEKLIIYSRVYFNEPNIVDEQNLTEIQYYILNCIFLRHDNGYIRQKRLENLIGAKSYFILPFTFHLLGEYVVEIIEVLDKYISDKNIENYIKFKNENPRYYQKIERRVISYWNLFYRLRDPELQNYIGIKILKRLEK